MTTNEPAERGAASILISLDDGVITVTHGDSDIVLGSVTAKVGDWDKLWDFLRNDLHITDADPT